ncbi:MAG: cadherin domain-containing protein, partial [Pirellulaceae bacterium]
APSIENLTIDDILANTTDPAFEHSPAGTVIGMIPIADPDVDDESFTFNIVSGNTGGAFEIVTVEVDGEYFGEIRVVDPTALDFATNPTFDLVVTVTDSGGPDGVGNEITSDPINVVINLRDVIQNQTLDSIAENPIGGPAETEVGDVVGQITSPDFDYSDYSFEIVGGNTGGAFVIDANGVITVANADPSVLDFEGNPLFELEIEVTDTGAPSISPYTVTVSIGLLDRNDVPTVDQAALDALDVTTFENIADPAPGFEAELDVVVDLDGYFNAADASQSLTYEIVGGNTGDAFAINGDNEIVVNNPEALDFETNPVFTLTIRATDDGDNPAPLFVDGTLTITLENLNELPVADGDEITLDEPILFMDVEVGTGEEDDVVGNVGLVDPEGDTLTYTFVPGGTGDAYFSIDSNGDIILENPLPDDWDPEETSREYTLIFDLADDNNLGLANGVKTAEGVVVTFTVTKNQPPEFVSPVETEFSISENVDGSIENGDDLTPVLVIEATDPEDDTITYSVAPNASFSDSGLAGLFEVVEDAGVYRLVVADAANLRYNDVNDLGAVDGAFDVDLVANDGFNETRMTITITVVDENDQPEFEQPVAGSITIEELVQHADDANNNIQVGDVVYDLTGAFSDVDVSDTLTYSIVATYATGDEDLDLSGAFVIDGNHVEIADATLINFEALPEGSITLTILADDGNGGTVTG